MKDNISHWKYWFIWSFSTLAWQCNGKYGDDVEIWGDKGCEEDEEIHDATHPWEMEPDGRDQHPTWQHRPHLQEWSL